MTSRWTVRRLGHIVDKALRQRGYDGRVVGSTIRKDSITCDLDTHETPTAAAQDLRQELDYPVSVGPGILRISKRK